MVITCGLPPIFVLTNLAMWANAHLKRDVGNAHLKRDVGNAHLKRDVGNVQCGFSNFLRSKETTELTGACEIHSSQKDINALIKKRIV